MDVDSGVGVVFVFASLVVLPNFLPVDVAERLRTSVCDAITATIQPFTHDGGACALPSASAL